eukprot:TRINITY_DN1152_c0_g2_i2.p1 TRINITY_DN1152_c0_g2~~TRINITY_DN1152_c0_g2_i2.p1  ORF type:complete len:244 (-),score=42.86 TRINITY_DN1152_c0_g2_i2:23-754(-)
MSGDLSPRGDKPRSSTKSPPLPSLVPALDLRELDIDCHPFFIMEFESIISIDTFYLPIEIGITSFSLDNESTTRFQRFLDPGSINHRQYNMIISTTKKHGLPGAPIQETEPNFEKIWRDILYFLRYNYKNGTPQPNIYSKAPTVSNYCLEWIAQRAGLKQELGAVRPIEALVYHMHQVKEVEINTTGILEYFDELANGIPGDMKCRYHKKKEKNDGKKYSCALGHASALTKKVRDVHSTVNKR